MEDSKLSPVIVLFSLCLALAGCGGGGSGSSASSPDTPPTTPSTPTPPAEPDPPVEPDPPTEPDPDPDPRPVDPNVPPPEPEPDPEPTPPLSGKQPGLLTLADSDAALAATIRSAMRENRFVGDPGFQNDFSPAPPTTEPAPIAEFNTTNLQEAGVDESDRVKYDGQVLYVSDRQFVPEDPADDDTTDTVEPSSHFLPAPSGFYQPVITLNLTDPTTAGVEEISRIVMAPDDSQYRLYIRTSEAGRQLVGITDNYQYPAGAFADFSYWQSQYTSVVVWSVDDPAAPQTQFRVDLEGALLTSRRIGNLLYLVTRFSPQIAGLVTYPVTDEDLDNNEAILASSEPDLLLPKYAVDNGDPLPLVSGETCYVPNEAYEGGLEVLAGNAFVTITAIDLDAPETINSVCVNAYASEFYVSRDNVYITTNAASTTTLIHKFALNNGDPLYRGSGAVPGYLGTRKPSFLMSEEGDDLRVLTSLWSNNRFPLPFMPLSGTNASDDEDLVYYGEHQLTILRENPDVDQLDRIARLPNDERQTPIGKPDEDIFGARFAGDRAYVVTFRTIDPLYVIDLADPLDPLIRGELEIPGFSTLLQPLGDGLLLGVGNEVPLDNPFVQGIKVALFDVADPTAPIELASEVIGRRGSYSPVLDDHRALAILPVEEGVRLGIPIQNHERVGGPFSSSGFAWSDSSLYQFEVDTSARSLTTVGKLVADAYSPMRINPSVTLREARGFFNGDAVFFSLLGLDELVTGLWGEE